MFKRFFVILISSILVIIFDQLTKYYILNNFDFGGNFFIFDKILSISPFQNRGIAFGVSLPLIIFFIISFIIIILLFEVYFKYFAKSEKLYLDLAIGFIIGGALGNIIDRIRLGYVLDFIDFQIWPVFNVADVFIVVGVGILSVKILKSNKDDEVRISNS